MPSAARILLFNKPFQVLCQFTDPQGRPNLADFIPLPGFYAAGRLDADSEGLLLLTDDGALQHRIAHPQHKLWKTYWVQVEGLINETALAQLRQGVLLKDGLTRPARADCMDEPPELWRRDPPVRFRAQIPTSWLCLQIAEGKNRQVRRMTAAVGFPTLRLIRAAIGDWKLGDLPPGQWSQQSLSASDWPLPGRSDGPRPTDRPPRRTPSSKKGPGSSRNP